MLKEKNYKSSGVERCRFCGSKKFSLFRQVRGFKIIKCADCGLICLDCKADGEVQRKMYAEPYYRNIDGSWLTRGYPDYFALAKVFDRLNAKRIESIRRIVPEGRLLDIGCGPGFFLNKASEYFDVTGLEVSEFAAKYAREHFNLNVFTRPLPNRDFKDGEFACITLWDTLEHLPEPFVVLREARRLLRKGGLLALETGDVSSLFARLSGKRWHLYNLPEHLYFFSRQVLTRVLPGFDFRLVRISYDWTFYPLAFVLDRLIRTLAPQKGFKSKRLFWEKIAIPCNLFDIMTVEAVKE